MGTTVKPKVKRPKLGITTGVQARELRRKLGMNQDEFWARIGVTQSGGSRYESGRNVPKPTMELVNLVYGKEKTAHELLTWLRGWQKQE